MRGIDVIFYDSSSLFSHVLWNLLILIQNRWPISYCLCGFYIELAFEELCVLTVFLVKFNDSHFVFESIRLYFHLQLKYFL